MASRFDFPKAVARQIIESVWDSIQPDWRPSTLEPFGCGYYGCAYPTSAPDVVLKLTTDPSEAAFVQAALRIHGDRFPPGIVHYYRIDATTSTYADRVAYLIWREEAFHVGSTIQILMDTGDRAEITEGRLFLRLYYTAGDTINEMLHESKDPHELQRTSAAWYGWARDNTSWKDVRSGDLIDYSPPQRFAATVHAMGQLTQQLATVPAFKALGDTLGVYTKHGLLIIDISNANLGQAPRDGQPTLVITDPGEVLNITTFLHAM
jgi:hypothetical protein